jgi:pimeloyl-ACP methyl ester carboxylesterase
MRARGSADTSVRAEGRGRPGARVGERSGEATTASAGTPRSSSGSQREVAGTVVLPVPPDRAFAVVNDPATAPLIDPGVRRWQPVAVPIGPGTEFRISARIGLLPLRLRSQCVRWEPPRAASYRSIRPAWPIGGVAEHRFEPEPSAATRYTWSLRLEARGPVGRLTLPLVATRAQGLIDAQQWRLHDWLTREGDDEGPDHRVVVVPGGRVVSATWYGAASGPVVVVLDGPGSRAQAQAASDLAAALGIRLLAPDRPGFGRSTPDATLTFASWADDLAVVLEQLAVARCALWTQSGGTPFSLAVALRHPSRIAHLGIASGVGPPDAPGALDGMDRSMRTTYRLARTVPAATSLPLRLLRAVHRRWPERAARAFLRTRPTRDRAVIERGDVWPLMVTSIADLTQAPTATRRELALLARPWDLALEDVRVPTTLWHGTADTTHPPSMARTLAERIPGAELHLVPGAASFDLLDHRAEMLRTLTADLRTDDDART